MIVVAALAQGSVTPTRRPSPSKRPSPSASASQTLTIRCGSFWGRPRARAFLPHVYSLPPSLPPIPSPIRSTFDDARLGSWLLTGSARGSTSGVVLTPSAGGAVGAAWMKSLVDLMKPFTFYFNVSTDVKLGKGGESLAIVLHNDARGLSALGLGGADGGVFGAGAYLQLALALLILDGSSATSPATLGVVSATNTNAARCAAGKGAYTSGSLAFTPSNDKLVFSGKIAGGGSCSMSFSGVKAKLGGLGTARLGVLAATGTGGDAWRHTLLSALVSVPPTPSLAPTNSPPKSGSRTKGPAGTRSPTLSPSKSRAGTRSPTLSPSKSRAGTPSGSAGASRGPSLTGTISRTRSLAGTRTRSPSGSAGASRGPSLTVTVSRTRSVAGTRTRSPSGCATTSRAPSSTGTITPSRTLTGTRTPSFTGSTTISATFTPTITASLTITATISPSLTVSSTPPPAATPAALPNALGAAGFLYMESGVSVSAGAKTMANYNGVLYIGGDFGMISDGTLVGSLATLSRSLDKFVWGTLPVVPQTYTPLNPFFYSTRGYGYLSPGSINALVVLNGKLYVGGAFTNILPRGYAPDCTMILSPQGAGPKYLKVCAPIASPASNIAVFDGIAWSTLRTPSWSPQMDGVPGAVSALAVFGGNLFVGACWVWRWGVPSRNLLTLPALT